MWRVPGREGVGKVDGVGGMRSGAGGGQESGEAWGCGEHGGGEAEGLLRLGAEDLWRDSPGGAGEGGEWGSGSPCWAQGRRRWEDCVRVRGTGLAFMLVRECPRGKRVFAHDSIWRELLLHAKAWQVMRWGVFLILQHSIFTSFS